MTLSSFSFSAAHARLVHHQTINLKDCVSKYQSILVTRIIAEASACSSGLKITVVPKELMHEQL